MNHQFWWVTNHIYNQFDILHIHVQFTQPNERKLEFEQSFENSKLLQFFLYAKPQANTIELRAWLRQLIFV